MTLSLWLVIRDFNALSDVHEKTRKASISFFLSGFPLGC